MADAQSPTGTNKTLKGIGAALYTIIIGAVGVYVGYYINDYLSKDNIRIEQVNFIPETNKFLLPEEDYKIFKKLLDASWLELSYPNLRNLLEKATYKTESRSYSQLQQGINKKELDMLVELIEDFMKRKKSSDSKYDEYITRLKQFKAGDNIIDIMTHANEIYAWKYSDMNVDTISELSKRYENLRNVFLKQEKEIPRIINGMKSFKQKIIGLMKINIAFLNLGNTDGLFSKQGFLYIKDKHRIRIKISDDNLIPKVEKRSMLQTDFEIIEAESTPQDMEYLNKIMVNGLLTEASVELNDIRSKPIRSKNYPFPLLLDTK
jgi:hypothetical protein